MSNALLLSPPTEANSSQPQVSLSVLRRKAREALQESLRNTKVEHAAVTRLVIINLNTRRVWIARRRCHHGLVGAVTTATGLTLKQPALVLAGLALMWDDKEDWPWPMQRL